MRPTVVSRFRRAAHYDTREAMDALGVTERTINRMAKTGRLRKVWHEGQRFFPKGQVDQMAREQSTKGG